MVWSGADAEVCLGHVSLPPRDDHLCDDQMDDMTFEGEALACLDHVARFSRALTRDEAAADDLVQETYLRAFRGRHTYRPDGGMRRWLFTICKHAFLREREREARDVVSLDVDPTDETRAAALLHNRLVASGQDALLDRVDLGPAIAGALQDLPDNMRAAVMLVDVEGYAYADAAELLGVPIGTVRSRLFRARRVLQESLVFHAQDAGFAASGTPGENT